MSLRRLMAVLGLAAGLILFGAPLPARAECPGDLDGDYDIDLADLAQLLGHYGTNEGAVYEDGDLDGDGDVDLSDLAQLLSVYGTTCEPEDMVSVPGGEFEMGDPWDEGDTRERPVHTVYLSPYYIDTYEVTNQQYADGLNWAWAQLDLITVFDGVVYRYGDSFWEYAYCDTSTADPDSRIHWNGTTFTVTAGKESHPMAEVSWCGSVAFCNWRSAMEDKPLCYDLDTWACNFGVAGYRLPTEAEWEKAAGWDPVQQRHYRFGEHTDGCGYNCLDGQRANYGYNGDPFDNGTTPVGFYNGELHYKVDFGWPGSETSYQTQNAQSYYGCYDMTGNVWEWCYDWFDPYYYDEYPPDGWPPNPTGSPTGSSRVLRGGEWYTSVRYCRSAKRESSTYTQSLPGPHCIGFRCVLGTP